MRTIQKLFSAAAAVLIIFSMSTAAYAAAEGSGAEEPLVRVAVPVSACDADTGTTAAYVGYITEYLHEISQHTGWICEITEVPGTYEEGLQRALQMLRDGTADLVAPVRYMEERSGEICFSQNSFVTAAAVL